MTRDPYPMHCTGCGRSGNHEDGIEVGRECVDEDCDGIVVAYDRALNEASYLGVDILWDEDTGEPYAEIPAGHQVLDANRNGTHFCTLCRCVVILFDDDVHTCTLHDWKDNA